MHKTRGSGLDSFHLGQLPKANSSEHSNQSSGSIRGGVFLKQLINQCLITHSNASNDLIFIGLFTGILLNVFNLEKMLKKHAGD